MSEPEQIQESVQLGRAQVALIALNVLQMIAFVAILVVMIANAAWLQLGAVVAIIALQLVLNRRAGDDPPAWLFVAGLLGTLGMYALAGWAFDSHGSTTGLVIIAISVALTAVSEVVRRAGKK